MLAPNMPQHGWRFQPPGKDDSTPIEADPFVFIESQSPTLASAPPASGWGCNDGGRTTSAPRRSRSRTGCGVACVDSYLQPVYIGCLFMSGHLSAKGLCPHRKDGNASCDLYVGSILARTQPIVKTIRPPVCLSVFTPIVVRSIKRVRARSRFDPQHSRLASKTASFARVACSGSSELLGQQLRGLCHCWDRSPGRVGGR
jgi:hypothetical protein